MLGNDGLPVSPIDRCHRQFREFDAVDAVDVERYHVGAVGLTAVRKYVDSAVDAELMADRVLVEKIFPQVFRAGTQLETLLAAGT